MVFHPLNIIQDKKRKMKKLLIFGFLFAFLMTAFSVDLDAQYSPKRKKKKKKTTTERNNDYFDESGRAFTDRLWYGADVTIDFFGGQGQSDFIWGISPMVGYKFTDNFSAGPRLSFLNRITKIDVGLGSDLTLNTIDWGGALFTRHKILGTYFIHAEVELLSEEIPDNTFNSNGEVGTFREAGAHYYLGGGYSADNGALGFSATVLWDFAEEFDSSNIPIVARFGITYKF